MQLKRKGVHTRYTLLRIRLILLLAIMILPFIAFSFYKAVNIYNQLESEAHKENRIFAENIATNIDDFIKSTGELLISIANSEEVSSKNYEKLNVWFKKILPKYPHYANIMFVNLEGNVVASGLTKNKNVSKPVNVIHTAYYKRAIESTGIAVGDFMIGKICGIPVVHITYPAYDKSNNKIGFVATSINLASVQKKFIQGKMSANMIIAVYDNKGTLLARSAKPEKFLGKNFSKKIDMNEMLSKKSGTGKIIVKDGTVKIYAFAAVSAAPWYVRIETNNKKIEEYVRAELADHFSVFIPLLLIAVIGWLWIGRDVDILHKRTEYLSLIDPLTELWNFRKLNHDFEHEISHAARYNEPLAFAMIDIDHFKNYNDLYGHQAGDRILQEVATVLMNSVREVDSVYRYGGEEICVLMPKTNKDGAKALAERMRENIEKAVFPFETSQPLKSLTISIGVATFPEDASTAGELVKKADIALYKAKQEGRNRVEVYH